jgi:hypothetical protein
VAAVQHTFTNKQYTEYRERNIHNNKKIEHTQIEYYLLLGIRFSQHGESLKTRTYTTLKKLTNLGLFVLSLQMVKTTP